MSEVVVITGATSGLGKGLADKYRAKGSTVITLSRSETNTQTSYQCDVSDSVRVEEVFKSIGAKYSKIDILINNAGYGVSGAIEMLTTEQVNNNMDVNFFGTLYCSKYALPYMSSGCKIINIASACSLFALPYRAMYCASKSAVNMLSYGMRMELANSGIQVCSICPGDIKTNFTKHRVKSFETNNRYGDRITKATNKLDSREDKRMSPEYAVAKIYKAIERKKTKPLVIIGAKYKFFWFGFRILPTSWFLAIIKKIFA